MMLAISRVLRCFVAEDRTPVTAQSWDGGPHPNAADVREPSSMLPCLDGEECQGPEKRSAQRIAPQRAATRMRPLLWVQQRWSAQIDSFFFARQRALPAPPMDLDAKPPLHLLEPLPRS